MYTLLTIIGLHYGGEFSYNSNGVMIIGIVAVAYIVYSILIKLALRILSSIEVGISVKLLCIIIGILWLVSIVLSYPAGSIPFDSFYINGQYVGQFPKSNNHPYLVTLLMGNAMRFGQFLLSDNMGIFLYICLQAAVMYAALLTAVYFMGKWGIKQKYIKIMLLFYLICPLYIIFVAVDRKDVLFSAFIFLYCVVYADSIIRTDKSKKEKNVLMLCEIMFGIFSVLLRHNGIFVIFFAQVIRMCYLKKKDFRLNIIHMVLILSCYFLANNAIFPMLGVQPVLEERVYASANVLRFQQTARYAIKHEQELKDKDKEVFTSMFGKFDYVHRYNPYNGDPIYALYSGATQEEIESYDRLWLRYFLDDPVVYLGAYVQFVYLYVYPYDTPENSVFSISDGWANTGYFDIYRSEIGNTYINYMQSAYNILSELPGIKVLYSAGFYSWIMLFCLFYAVHKKSLRLLVIYSPVVVSMIVLVGGFLPCNGYLHYAFPVILTAPFMATISSIETLTPNL